MKKFALIISLALSSHLNAQEMDSTFHRIILLDSVWTRGFTTKTTLQDSISYLELKGNRAELSLVSEEGDRWEKGRIYRMTTQFSGTDTLYRFYLVDRGAFKGSLTVELTIGAANSTLHIMNAWSTYDRFFTGTIGEEGEIVRPVRKKYKPGKK